MLQTKFQCHWPFNSKEVDLRGFTIYELGGYLGHVRERVSELGLHISPTIRSYRLGSSIRTNFVYLDIEFPNMNYSH